MNLKERGVTVGDLLIIAIIIISSIFILNKLKESDKQSHLTNEHNVFSKIQSPNYIG